MRPAANPRSTPLPLPARANDGGPRRPRTHDSQTPPNDAVAREATAPVPLLAPGLPGHDVHVAEEVAEPPGGEVRPGPRADTDVTGSVVAIVLEHPERTAAVDHPVGAVVEAAVAQIGGVVDLNAAVVDVMS